MVSSVLRDARRIVVKVGSSLVTNEGRGLDETAIGEWSRQLAALVRGDGGLPREGVMVSSGAIAEGMKRLGWTTRPNEVHELQAAAAVGQMGLAQMYETKLREQGMGSAQVLLTHADLADRERYLNARSTLLTLLRLGVVPVINENDTVVNDEIKFGDNDTLGALAANLVEADALTILTDQKGLYTADPRRDASAQFVHEAKAGDPALEAMAGGAGSSIGKGGMITKILAAKRAAGSAAYRYDGCGGWLFARRRDCRARRIRHRNCPWPGQLCCGRSQNVVPQAFDRIRKASGLRCRARDGASRQHGAGRQLTAKASSQRSFSKTPSVHQQKRLQIAGVFHGTGDHLANELTRRGDRRQSVQLSGHTVLRIRIETGPRWKLHARIDQHGPRPKHGARVFALPRAHATAQVAVALLVARQETGQFRQRHFIDATLEFDHDIQRNPVVVPAPGVEFRMVGGTQVQVPVVSYQLKQIPDLFLALVVSACIAADVPVRHLIAQPVPGAGHHAYVVGQ